MADSISRRWFTALGTGLVLGSAAPRGSAEEKTGAAPAPRPVEAAFERDSPAPGFKPSWKKPQINRLLVQDFVIYAHSELDRRDIVGYLLGRGARIDIFCAAMMGQLDAVRSFLALQPHLIDAKGPHGLTLHFHAQVGQKESEHVLDYLQSIKRIELPPNPFLKKPGEKAGPGK
jgi:hypothetical protein